MENHKYIPELRFPEFEKEWENKKVGEISDKINSGKTPLGGEDTYTEQGILFIRSQNIFDNQLSYENATFIPEKINDTMKNSVVKPNDILLNITGASLGRSCVVPDDFLIGNVNQHVCIIRLNKNHEPRFIQPFFSSSKGQNLFIGLQTGSGREGLNFQSIKSINLFAPSLTEQKKIASFFTAIDKKISQLKQKKILLEEYKKGLIQKIFSQEIRFKDDNGQEFPKWEKKRLGSLLIERNTQAPKSYKYPLMAFVANKGVAHKGERYNREFLVNDGDNKKYKQTEYGDFIYSSNNLETGSIGLNNFGSASISPVYSIFQIGESCNSQFLNSLLICKSFINKMTKYRQGVVYGQWRIHESDFLKIEESIPSIEEQTKIANFLLAFDDKINHTRRQIEKAELWKKGLLQKMFV